MNLDCDSDIDDDEGILFSPVFSNSSDQTLEPAVNVEQDDNNETELAATNSPLISNESLEIPPMDDFPPLIDLTAASNPAADDNKSDGYISSEDDLDVIIKEIIEYCKVQEFITKSD